MIIWLNGPFGGGKTSVAEALLAQRAQWRLVDPELVGSMVRAALPDVPNDDFQDWPAWRLTHLPSYAAARSWLRARADLVVDTSDRSPADAAHDIVVAVRALDASGNRR